MNESTTWTDTPEAESDAVADVVTEPTDGAEAVDPVEVAQSSDPVDLTEAVDSVADTAESTDVADTAESTDVADTAESTDVTDTAESTDVTDTAESTDVTEAPNETAPVRSRLRQLEREGEVAADFLERLLDIADLDGDIDVDVDGDRAAVSIVDSEEGHVPRRLVGPDGQVLEALQELTRLAVTTATGERSRLMLDVAGFRAARRGALVEQARAAIEEVQASGLPKALANMTAFERKVIHDVVAASDMVSESEGVEPHRHIVILPA